MGGFHSWPDQQDPVPAGPPDLDAAVHAAGKPMAPKVIARRLRVAAALTLMQNEGWSKVFEAGADALEHSGAGALQWYSDTLRKVDGERMAAHAELETTRDRAHSLEVEVKDLERRLAASDKLLWAAKDLAVKTDVELEATRDRLAGLEVYAVELWDLLERSIRATSRDWYGNCSYCYKPAQSARHVHCWQCGGRQPDHLSDCPVGVALQVGAPERGRQTLDELERLRSLETALRKVDEHPYDLEAAADLDEALTELERFRAALDRAAAVAPHPHAGEGDQ